MSEIQSTERWKPIPGYEGFYEVSDLGCVRSLDHETAHGAGHRPHVYEGRVLRLNETPGGRLHVTLMYRGRPQSVQVHRLVLKAFVGPCPDGMECCHGDGDPTNNRLSNLRWDTRSANQFDSVRHGTNAGAAKTHCKHGHPFDDENTRIRPTGRRACRACARRTSKAHRLRLQTRLAFVGLGALAAAGILSMPQAHADPASYLQSLSDHGLNVYEPSLALATGYKICAMLNVANGVDVAEYVFTHTSWSDVPDLATAQREVLVAAEELCQWQDHRGQAAPAPATDFGPVAT